MLEGLKEILISQNIINEKVAHKQGEYKGIATMVTNTSQTKSSKEIGTTAKIGAICKILLV